jgi:hypothetical protein
LFQKQERKLDKVADASALIRALQTIGARLPAALEASMTTLTEIGVSNAKSSTLFKNRTGNLRNNIKATAPTFSANGSISAEVLADTSYAGYVEYGNNQKGPRIYTVHAKALRFVINGKVVFAKSVKAHGPLPFMGNAQGVVESLAPTIIGNAVARLFE